MTDELVNGVGGGVESACVGKVAYGTRGEAQRNLEHIRRRAPPRALMVYQCHFCRQYHIGSDRPTVRIRRTSNLVNRVS